MSQKVILPLFSEKSHLIISMLQMTNLLKRGFWTSPTIRLSPELHGRDAMHCVSTLTPSCASLARGYS
jgi:hypothetical protein